MQIAYARYVYRIDYAVCIPFRPARSVCCRDSNCCVSKRSELDMRQIGFILQEVTNRTLALRSRPRRRGPEGGMDDASNQQSSSRLVGLHDT